MAKAKKIRFGKRAVFYAVVAVLLSSVLAVGSIYAKYAVGSQGSGYVSSPQFYFTSDILQERAPTYTLNPGAEGFAEISFALCNYADELRIAQMDIDFTVSVNPSKGVEILVDGVASPNGTGRLTANPEVGSRSQITVSGLRNGTSYEIAVEGRAGFVSTLHANVTVQNDEAAIYKHVDNSDRNVLLLTVLTQNLTGTVKISFPAGLIPDATDEMLDEIYNFEDGTYKEGSFTDSESFTQPHSARVYRFFKTEAYSGGEFTVILGTQTATDTNLG